MRTLPPKQLCGFIALIVSIFLSSCTTNKPAQAPNLHARFVDQRLIATNACGPTALLNSLRSGDAPCQSAAAAIPGASDTQKLRHLILHHGAKKSRHLPSRIRWSKRGINPVDLRDVAEEIHPKAQLSFYLASGSSSQLLKNAHHALAQSLRNGFPPIVCIRRYHGTIPAESHFLSLIAISAIDENDSSVEVTCIDPAGGKKIFGTIAVNNANPQALRASLPDSPFIKATPPTAIIVMDAMILRD